MFRDSRSGPTVGPELELELKFGLDRNFINMFCDVLWMCFLELQFQLDRTESTFGRDFEDF